MSLKNLYLNYYNLIQSSTSLQIKIIDILQVGRRKYIRYLNQVKAEPTSYKQY